MRTLATPLRLALMLAALLALEPARAELGIKDAWVRATVAGQTATGAYMVITSDRDVTLAGVASAWADHCALHEMMMHGDMMMMKPVDKLAIVAGKPLVLDEKNYHVMLEGLKRQVHVGDKVRLTLTFVDDKGVRRHIDVDAVARPLATHEEHAHDHMGG